MKGSVDDHCGPVEAAPSTDEGEARPQDDLWDAYNEAQAFYLASSLSNHNVREAIRDSKREAIEAAIRAPLEERIRELEAIAFHTDGVMHIATERITELEAENARLREALRMVRVRLAAGWVANPAVEDVASELIWTTLAPPSSTEGTKEVEG